MNAVFIIALAILIDKLNYSRSSHKRPPREFQKVVVTRAGRLQEYALVSDPMVKQWRVVAHESIRI